MPLGLLATLVVSVLATAYPAEAGGNLKLLAIFSMADRRGEAPRIMEEVYNAMRCGCSTLEASRSAMRCGWGRHHQRIWGISRMDREVRRLRASTTDGWSSALCSRG